MKKIIMMAFGLLSICASMTVNACDCQQNTEHKDSKSVQESNQ